MTRFIAKLLTERCLVCSMLQRFLRSSLTVSMNDKFVSFMGKDVLTCLYSVMKMLKISLSQNFFNSHTEPMFFCGFYVKMSFL